MGHVDHGKTLLLDAIRSTNVADREAGGITQHIGASIVEHADSHITFIDTPGHEAFTRMRLRGAQVTDIVVLVVAADDGVMPQTVEAIDHARAAGVPIIVAINKIDRPNANVERVKQQLGEHNLAPESWGGDTVVVEVSAKMKQNLDELLEMLSLTAEMQELTASRTTPARGTVLEARLDRQRGSMATLIIQEGTLKVGDNLVAGMESGKVRAMIDDRGSQLKESGPSMAIEVLGLGGVPEAGDNFQVVEATTLARKVSEIRQERQRRESLAAGSRLTLDDLHAQMRAADRIDISVLIKADVQGSVEVLKDSLLKLSGDKVNVKIIHAAAGGITESDVLLASASNAIVVGFNVRPERGVADIAVRGGVDLRLYTIIYQLIDEFKQAMLGKLKPEYRETALGVAEVRDTFRIPKVGSIAGCYIIEGKMVRDAEVRLVRDSVVIFEGKVGSLRRFKDDVSEVQQGFECGINIANFSDVKIGDVIEAFELEELEAAL
jgi:translation initiation factor IF-2